MKTNDQQINNKTNNERKEKRAKKEFITRAIKAKKKQYRNKIKFIVEEFE